MGVELFREYQERSGNSMAQRVNVVLVDDLDGSDAVETVSFALDGVDYEIDLNEQHASELRNALSLYVGHGRRTGGRRRTSSAGGSKRSAASSAGGPSAAEIRTWARENGYDVPERGRVSADVREAYAAAH
jgi:hypothetical protein